MRKASLKRDVTLFISYILINVLCYLIGLAFLARIDIQVLRMWLASFDGLAPFAFIFVYTLLFIIPFNPIPATVIAYFALISFGPLYATLYTVIADTIGILINYYVARHFSSYFSERTKSYLQKLSGKHSWWALMAARVTPMTAGFAGADFPSYAAGLLGMPIPRFLVVSLVPWIVIDILYYYGLNLFVSSKKIALVFALLAILSLSLTIIKFYTTEKKKVQHKDTL